MEKVFGAFSCGVVNAYDKKVIPICFFIGVEVESDGEYFQIYIKYKGSM